MSQTNIAEHTGQKTEADNTHFSVASFDASSLGQLEDLFSIGSHEQPTISGTAVPYSHFTPSNAVHMEIQENAKLPTFNLSVDRTNSSHTRTSKLKLAPDTANDLDEMLRLSEKDINLTEMFLHSQNRSSVNMNWNSAGALLSHIGEGLDGDDDSSADQSVEAKRALHSAHPPVPRSVHVHHSNGTSLASPMHTAQTNNTGPVDTFAFGSQHTTTQQYPYHRSLPLPIPKRQSPETTSQGADTTDTAENDGVKHDELQSSDDAMTAALATAAALASHRQSSLGSRGLPAPTASKRARASQSSNEGNTANTSQTSTKPSPAQFRSSIPSASILEATKRRSQFGFGNNHVVPSVPVPPPARKPQFQPSKTSPNAQLKPPPPSAANSAEAYERKKQRAKESRVKLNESIERTAIAINVSGTQSSQRAAQLNTVRVSAPGLRSNTLKSLEECTRLAEEAKKWDRPSFVGTAASLIQALNAQCEALMSEMLEMKRLEEERSETGVNMAMQTAESSRVSPSPLYNGDSNMLQNLKANDLLQSPKRSAPVEGPLLLSDTKRARLESTPPRTNVTSIVDTHFTDTASIESLMSVPKALQSVLSMLDPKSLVRCSQLSKSWNGIFQGDQAWLDSCTTRYGQSQVHLWKQKMKGEDRLPCKSINLYREMDAANVKPHCIEEGYLFLGGARMPGKVSAWASMAIRSNGETIRSVLKESDNTMYSSLPVVELRFLIQNTGSADYPIVLKEQTITVDASTRRRGEEMKEIEWDGRFQKTLLNLDGTPRAATSTDHNPNHDVVGELCRLRLFESVILTVHIHARGCPTTSKFQQKSNFTKVLVKVSGTTLPLVIPFIRESGSM